MLRSLVVVATLLFSLATAQAEPSALEARLSAPTLPITFEAPGQEADQPTRAKLMVDLRPANAAQSRAFLVHALTVLSPGGDAAALSGFVDGNLAKLKPGQSARTTAGGRGIELKRESDVMATVVVQAK